MNWKFFFAAACVASPSFAAPAYLSCKLGANAEEFPLTLAIDEQNQTVILNIPETGFTGRYIGVFTASTIEFTDHSAADLTYRLSRVSLAFSRQVIWPGHDTTPQPGHCSVDKTPKRAF